MVHSIVQGQIVFEQDEQEKIRLMMRGLIKDTFEDIVSDPVFGQQILKDPLYKATYSLPKRDPLFMFFPFLTCKKGIDIFYQQTSKAVLVDNQTTLSSYINIEQEGLIEALDRFDFISLDIPEVLALFAPAKIQERRLGCVFHLPFKGKVWSCVIQIPFIFQLHNFYLTPQERIAIADAQLFKPRKAPVVIQDGPVQKPAGQGISSFIKQHLISDAMGLADIHVSLQKLVITKNEEKFEIGCVATVPTAWAFKKGIIGTCFDKQKAEPLLDLHADIIDLYGEGLYEQLQQNALDYGVAALDRLSTLLLEASLGNEGHFVISPFVQKNFEFKSSLQGAIRAQIDCFLPADQTRFFKKNIDHAALDLSAESDPQTEDEARIQINFLNQKLLEKVFPKAYKTRVLPGIALQGDVQLNYYFGNYQCTVGAQVWCQFKEHILSIMQGVNLDINAGTRPFASQSLVQASLNYELYENVFLKLQGGVCPLSYGKGKDFFMAFSCNWFF